MRAYSERLVVPASWWLGSQACVVLLGTTLWAGFSVLAGVAVYVVLEAACAALLLSWGSVRIEVTGTEILAGSRRLPLARIAEAAALDAAQTAALRGPRANPAAYLLIRPYLPKSVCIDIAGRPPGEPYWLIGTRKPALLADAIERARAGTDGNRPCDDAPGDHALQAGTAQHIHAATQGKDGNAS